MEQYGPKIIFFDTEVTLKDKKVKDIGAVSSENVAFHSSSKIAFISYIANAQYLCGHNVVHHDLRFLHLDNLPQVIDTLYLSPLLFPKRPYHSLLKEDKLQVDELNNPVNDSEKARNLFYDEVNAFLSLPAELQSIFYGLLNKEAEFSGFFHYMKNAHNWMPVIRGESQLTGFIGSFFTGKICAHADLSLLIRNAAVELAYTLALVFADDTHSITPYWLVRNYPQIEYVMKVLVGTPCVDGCDYCSRHFNIHAGLKRFFGYDGFRLFDGENLQERAVQAAVDGQSLLTVFPTGGGKSLTFQLPALMAGESEHGLTVVISPLQSLMKDQVDGLYQRGILDVVTINGMLDPVTRADGFNRVRDGSASLLYIAPEMLRSKTLERLLLSRHITRFVIDEAHCFSAWGQDFRVDYLYIADFIRKLQEQKQLKTPIPVSCFTATAKPKVIADICDYFKSKLNLELQLYATTSTRKNLRYVVQYVETEEEKYNVLRNLISGRDCPIIVYVSRTRKAVEIAEHLQRDGISALPFHGKMDTKEKVDNQNRFIQDEVQVIVATNAFGMGVDKSNVGLVIHYDISDSLENYVQEAGRAGRDPNTSAQCYILYNESDLDKHFILLNQTKLSMAEIQQVWKAVKSLTRRRPEVTCSALEIARQAGWDSNVGDVETRVKTAISALETAGYLKRGTNVPHVYATSIQVKNMDEAHKRLMNSHLLDERGRQNAVRIIKSLISSRSVAQAQGEDAESRVDYLADMLGLEKEDVIRAVNTMRLEGILSDEQDISAYIMPKDTREKLRSSLDTFSRLERFLLSQIPESGAEVQLKELNEKAQTAERDSSSVKNFRTIIYFLKLKGYFRKEGGIASDTMRLSPCYEMSKLRDRSVKRIELCRFIIDQLYQTYLEHFSTEKDRPITFSLLGLMQAYQKHIQTQLYTDQVTQQDVEEALLYLSKIGTLNLEGGFMVLYNAMQIKRISDSRQYKVDDYRLLNEFYKQKMQQIHIVGEYAKLMVSDYSAALQFVHDYFSIDFKKFISKYFKGERRNEIEHNISPTKYQQVFGALSQVQLQVINDKTSKYIVVAAGPGSGKTRLLVHKLASLLLMEDVKHEQLLMLTFSRAAATEFKKRLVDLVGGAAYFVEIKTFHSFSFDLMGKIGNLDDSKDVVKHATDMIRSGAVEPEKIAKTVLVIDEAQDMSGDEFELVKSLMEQNEEMRLIAVGDDDQNIYEWRGSNSSYFHSLVTQYQATLYEMVDNYRSERRIVDFANAFVRKIKNRMKTNEIHAIQEGGEVLWMDCDSPNLETPVADHLKANRQRGKCCVLTLKNEEAFRMYGLLLKMGIRSKLIQSVEGFAFHNLVELRYFVKQIVDRVTSPVISDELWQQAKEKTERKYKDSLCLDNILNFIADFEGVNKKKYVSDLFEFIKESNYEDFYDDEDDMVYISTIHKAKGREFDTVYMMINQANTMTDEECRKLYVGMTRAKRALFIYTDNHLFSDMRLSAALHFHDTRVYPELEEIAVQLTHKDVYLDFFKGKKSDILKLHSGSPLYVVDGGLNAKVEGRVLPMVRFSSRCRQKLEELKEKGYELERAEVAFVVAWKGENDAGESAVILPHLHLRLR